MLRAFTIVTIIWFAPFTGFAQDNYSESFFNVSKNAFIHIPSNACLNNDFQLKANYKSYFGKLSIIKTYFADVNIKLSKKTENELKSHKHVLGLGFYSDKEGEYFTKSRILFRYAHSLPLSTKYRIAGGGAFHLLNYSFDGTGAGANGSDWTYAASISSTIFSKNNIIAISFNDFNSPTIQPIVYEFTINPYMNVYAEKKINLGLETQLKAVARLNSIRGGKSSIFTQLGLIFSKSIGANVFYYSNIGYGATFDINNILLYENNMDFSFAYLIPKEGILPPVNQYEISILYYKKSQ